MDGSTGESLMRSKKDFEERCLCLDGSRGRVTLRGQCWTEEDDR